MHIMYMYIPKCYLDSLCGEIFITKRYISTTISITYIELQIMSCFRCWQNKLLYILKYSYLP